MGLDPASASLFALLWFGTGASLAQETTPAAVAVPAGRLVPGATNWVEVGVLGRLDAPQVSSSAGTARLIREVSTGVWRYAVPVPADADQVAIRVAVDGRPFGFDFETWRPVESALVVPRRIEGVAGGEPVRFTVSGEDLPDADELQIVVGEGRVSAVEAGAEGIEVTVEPEDSPFPRYIAVGVRDPRHDERPIWGQIRLRARPTLPLESEPGTEVTVAIGSREYGPLVVGADGRAEVRVDQYPEELVAVAMFEDDLGNETRQEIPLTRQGTDQLVSFPSGDIFPGEPSPILYLAGFRANGYPWRAAPPTCRSATSDLEVAELARGQWMVALPPSDEGAADDLRVDCGLGEEVTRRVRVPVVRGVAARLGLRVWPTELRTDFPFAELKVVLEDHRGDRLDATGVVLSADHGAVTQASAGRTQMAGEYDGTDAAEQFTDRVYATWDAPVGEGVVDTVQLGWGRIPDRGEAHVQARVMDAIRRPLVGEVVAFDLGAGEVSALSDERGVASARVPLPGGVGPVVLVARSGRHEVQAVGLRGLPGRPIRDHDLVETAELTLTPGRVSGLSVRVDPQVLRAAPGAVAFVYVDVEDRAGNLIPDDAVVLSASEGVLGTLRGRPDGTMVAEYVPAPSERPRQVEITAEVESQRTSTVLEIAPRPVRFTLGAWGGVQSNFGTVLAPMVALDGDLRVRSRLAGESLMLRIGFARYGFSSRVRTDAGSPATLTAAIYPVTAAALLRRDRGRFGVWGGGGLVVAAQDLHVRFGSQDLGSGMQAIAGPTAVGGTGMRLVGGELLWAVQASWLPVNAAVVGFRGNVGGLATGLGYRLVF